MSTMRKMATDTRYKLFAERRRQKVTLFSIFILAALVVILTGFQPPQDDVTEEYQVKAAFLLNFAQFVEWPATDFAGDSSIVIGILGKDPFGSYLHKLVEEDSTNGHPVVIRNFRTVREIKECHILYINLPSARLDNTIRALPKKNILTVSDGSNFIKVGGMIRFKNESNEEGNKIKLQINLDALKKTDIVVSSKLLRLSEIVE